LLTRIGAAGKRFPVARVPGQDGRETEEIIESSAGLRLTIPGTENRVKFSISKLFAFQDVLFMLKKRQMKRKAAYDA